MAMQAHRFGLLGKNISYSRSPELFEKIWGEAAVRYSFELIDTDDIASFVAEVKSDPTWGGFTVTTPHKLEILNFLNLGCSDIATQAGAVNVVRRTDGGLMGHNSDVIGAMKAIAPLISDTEDTNALILGTGGAAKAVQVALRNMGLDYMTVSRTSEHGHLTYEQINHQLVQRHRLIINATPLGSAKHPGVAPPIPYDAVGYDHIFFDLTYTPAATPFMTEGLRRGATARNGLAMLWHQAVEAWHFLSTP